MSKLPLEPTEANLKACADALLRGELVAMPTETVYGIAANAFDAAAVAKIFTLKNRPADNPLIVHLANASELSRVADVSDHAEVLAEKLAAIFWPGPLTLVLPKKPGLPDSVTAGLPTVAVRVPAHPVARALLELVGVPLAAPSANRFMAISPTLAEHLRPEIVAGLFGVLEGGQSQIGLESTVLDLTTTPPSILRPGGIPRLTLERMLGPLGHAPEEIPNQKGKGRKSPGQHPRHYAPSVPLVLVKSLTSEASGLTFGPPQSPRQIQMPRDPVTYGRALYAALHTLERLQVSAIDVEKPPETTDWEAVWDRLRRASTPTPPTSAPATPAPATPAPSKGR